MSHVSDGALHAYLDGESSERQRAEIERHLSDCSACSERLEEARASAERASDLLAELEPTGVRPPPWREIETRAESRQTGRPQRSRTRSWLAWAASIAIAFGVGWFSRPYWSEVPAPVPESRRQIEAPAPLAEGARGVEPIQGRDRASEPESDDRLAQVEGDESEVAPTSRRAAVAAEESPAAPPPEEVHRRESEAVASAEEPASPRRDTLRLAEEAAERKDTGVAPTVETLPDAVRGLAEPREAAETAAGDRARSRPAAQSITVVERGRAADASGFVSVSREAAPRWLGVQLLTLPELKLERIEAGPASELESGVAGRVAIRQVYRDALGRELVLVQQWTGEVRSEEQEPTLVIDPSGVRSYRWSEAGYQLALQGRVSADSLRALAERVR